MTILLLALRWVKFGGWPTYIWHLKQALEANGMTVTVMSLQSPTGAHDWVKKLTDLNLLKKFDIVHIVVLDAKYPHYNKLVNLRKNYIITVHDPAELRNKYVQTILKAHDHPLIIAIRKSLLEYEQFSRSVKFMQYIPHPYERTSNGKITGDRIVSTARVDFDKNTKILLDADCEIEIWTGSINRIYDFFDLGQRMKSYPYYKGGFDSLNNVYAGACALVDLSVIKGDGGGTQYTFLEAMDFGLSLICHKSWQTGSNDELVSGEHYIPVETAEQLRKIVKALRNNWKNLDNNEKYSQMLKVHDYQLVGGLYKNVYKDWLAGKVGLFTEHKKVSDSKRRAKWMF